MQQTKEQKFFASFFPKKKFFSDYESLVTSVIAIVAFLFFARRARFGLTALGFGDETMHLLGGWALDSGDRLYRNFIDLHGPCIFMLAQIYGALFGWAHANDSRMVIAGLATLAGFAVTSSPALRGPSRAAAAALYFGLLATVWLVQGLYLFSYYPISGAFAVITLAWFVLPACSHARIPAGAAAGAGIASALLAFSSFSEAPTAVLLSAAGCLAGWQGRQKHAIFIHLLCAGCAGLLLLAWLAIWGDVLGYLTFHVITGMTVYPQFGPLSLRGLVKSLVPSTHPDHLVQSAAVIFSFLGSAAALALALRPGSGRIAAGLAVLAVAAGLILLDVRGLSIFQDGAFLMAGIGWFAAAAPALAIRTRSYVRHAPLLAATACVAVIVATDLVLRHAIFSPPPMTRAQFLGLGPYRVAERQEGPLFDTIRRLTRPDERILALVYRPETYFGAQRLPMDRFYDYLPENAVYARSPWFGERRDLCDALAISPPPVIVFDNWVVWGTYAPKDYMPCLFKILAEKYKNIPEPGDNAGDAAKLYVRADRAP